MRILVAGYDEPDSFADNVADSLRGLGHEVVCAAARDRPSRAGRVFDRFLEARGRSAQSRLERWILRTARSYRPDLFVAPTRPISEETLYALEALGVRRRVAWWGDSPGNLRGMNLLSDRWTLVCMKDRAGVEKLRRVGVRAEYLLEAMNPRWHTPVAGFLNDRVAIAGNFYGFRQRLVQMLADRGVKFDLFGGSIPAWSVPAVRASFRGKYIVRDEKSRVFGEALACLNSTSFSEGNSLNCRAFEVAAAGGLQIIEQRSCVEEAFEPGKEILVFECIDDVLGHLEWAKRAPEEAARVRFAGAKRARAEHTYETRLRQILRWVDA